MEGVEFIDDGAPLALETRSSFDVPPNDNDPADVPPATVGPPAAVPGDPDGVEVIVEDGGGWSPPIVRPSAWSGWPAEWRTPSWDNRFGELIDAAWMCLDLNASVIASMPPYAAKADGITKAPEWMTNPDPDIYSSYDEFAKQLWWDFQLGEAFVLCTARYADGWPARFRVIEPWLVNAEMGADGRRHYTIGTLDPGPDLLHIRYKSSTSNARGTGPLDAGRYRLLSAGILARYAAKVAEGGGVPYYVIKHPDELKAKQVEDLQAQWWQSRMSQIGMPAVLSGGIEIETLQISPRDMALLELSQFNESRIAVLLGVPPFLVGLPSGGDSMTYQNVVSIFDYHWRAGLRPKVSPVVAALSGWALPRGTVVEIDRDEYVRDTPLVRAQTWEILHRLGVVTAEGIARIERFTLSDGAVTDASPTPIGAAT